MKSGLWIPWDPGFSVLLPSMHNWVRIWFLDSACGMLSTGLWASMWPYHLSRTFKLYLNARMAPQIVSHLMFRTVKWWTMFQMFGQWYKHWDFWPSDPLLTIYYIPGAPAHWLFFPMWLTGTVMSLWRLPTYIQMKVFTAVTFQMFSKWIKL